MTFPAFLIFPAFYRICYGIARIILEKCADICVILKLFANRGFRRLFLFHDLMICSDCIGIGFSCIVFQPLLKFHIEGKAAANLTFKESAVLL